MCHRPDDAEKAKFHSEHRWRTEANLLSHRRFKSEEYDWKMIGLWSINLINYEGRGKY